MIRLDNVSYSYDAVHTALRHISFDLKEGSFHFLTGHSGAGKTTVFKMLYMDLLPTEGHAHIFGRNVASLSRDEIALLRRKMGIVFQEDRLLPHLNVRENVSLPLSLHGPLNSEQDHCVDEILNWVGLKHKLMALPESLSGGERQRVAIARAVVSRPKILIADEPTGNVDDAMAKRIMHLFTELNRHGTTVLVATHDESMMRAFNYPRLYLNNGQLMRVAA